MNLVRVIVVILLVVVAAVLATPQGRLPLAVRGLAKVLGHKSDNGGKGEKVPIWKKFLAFLLVILAFIIAQIA